MEQVHAASVNPLDVDMRQGYLRELLATGREHPLPFVLGRDFSGAGLTFCGRIGQYDFPAVTRR